MEPSGHRVATGRKCDLPENGSDRPFRNRWQPAATVSERMLKRVDAGQQMGSKRIEPLRSAMRCRSEAQ